MLDFNPLHLVYIGLLECVHAGKHVAEKHPDPDKWRDRKSRRIGCQFKVKLKSAGDAVSPWEISSIINKHNHFMLPGSEEYSRSALKLNPDHIEIAKGFAGARLEMPHAKMMLRSKYPGKFFLGKNITNTMRKFKVPRSNPVSNQAMDLIKLLRERKENDDWFFAADIDAITGQLDRVFWMDPDQRRLYRQYHDVVLNDSTAQTNPFGMPLNVSVVIDNTGASRVIALALTRSEGASDYAWILTQILVACGGKIPGVIVVDEDKGMEAASSNVFPNTRFVNCIWHLEQNFRKFVARHVRKADETNELLRGFQLAKDALTDLEFEDEWSKLMDKYGPDGQNNNPRIKSYLDRFYSRRSRWALPWTGTCFTAGVRSTQRVEKAHHLIKRLGSGKSTLRQLLQDIDDKVTAERQTKALLTHRHQADITAGDTSEAYQYFAAIQEENKRYLDRYGQCEMKKQMASSFYYTHTVYEVGKLVDLRDPCVFPVAQVAHELVTQ
jgi:hypothetical protein